LRVRNQIFFLLVFYALCLFILLTLQTTAHPLDTSIPIAVIDILKFGLDLYFFYVFNFILYSFQENRLHSGLSSSSSSCGSLLLHFIFGLIQARQLFYVLVSILRPIPFVSTQFKVRIFFVLLEEFLYPLIDLLTAVTLSIIFTKMSIFAQTNGLRKLTKSSNNAKQFYQRHTLLFSKNLEVQNAVKDTEIDEEEEEEERSIEGGEEESVILKRITEIDEGADNKEKFPAASAGVTSNGVKLRKRIKKTTGMKINESDMNADSFSNGSGQYVKKSTLGGRIVSGGKWAEDLESTVRGGENQEVVKNQNRRVQ